MWDGVRAVPHLGWNEGVIHILHAHGRKRKNLKQYIPFYLAALPGMIYIFINNYMPLPGLVLAFKKYSTKRGIWGSKWVGLSNFEYLFTTQDAWIITRNTIGYNLAFIVLNVIFGVLTAIVLSELTSKWKKVYQSVILLPHFLSSVIISYLVFAFLSAENGFINSTLLPLFGMEEISWYSEPKYWPFILVFVQVWRSIGYNCIVYLATILGIDRGIYEAASIDGASKIQQVFQITLPLLKPTIIMITLLAVGRIFNSDFGLFYRTTRNSSGLYNAFVTLDVYVYNSLFKSTIPTYGYASAAGFIQSVLGCLTLLAANAIVSKVDKENAFF